MCNDNNIPELLPAYREQSIDPAGRTRVEQHLASCEDCRKELALLSVIADDPVPVPDETFWAEMPDRIYQEVQSSRRRGGTRFVLSALLGWMFMPRLAWATAVVIVIAAVSWFMVRSAPMDLARTTEPAAETTMEDTASEPVNLTELNSVEFDAAAQWAQNEFSPIEEAITSDTQEHSSGDLSEDLSELSTRELDRFYEMLKKKEQDMQERLKKKPGNEKRLG